MGLTEAVLEVIDILQGRQTSRGESPDSWGRIVSIIAKLDCLPDSQVIVIEKAIAEAYCGWSDAQRRSIWYQTESGMTDDDSLCDTSFNGIGYALQVEMLDEVTRAAWQHAKEEDGGKETSAEEGDQVGEQGLGQEEEALRYVELQSHRREVGRRG